MGLDKKVVKLNGGLGNQMFQYAFAHALGKKINVDIAFDLTFFEIIKGCKNSTVREFELGVFNLNCAEATKEDLFKIIPTEHRSKLQRFLSHYLKMEKYKQTGNAYLQTNAYSFDRNLLNDNDYYCYDGYFQNEKYFVDYRNDLLNLFSLKEPIDEKNKAILSVINATDSISLHVRRGDYVTLESANKFHGTCPIEYYKDAIEYFANNVTNPHFFLFSDDIKWVIEKLKIDFPYTIIDFNQKKGYLDLELMKNCKHNIIANSSFSWWGAWLNENPEKIVIAPEKWTAKHTKKCEIIPKNWIQI